MDREKVISKLEKEVQRTYSTKTTVFQNGEKVSEEINTHREPCVKIPIEMADKILALLKEQEAVSITTDYFDGFGNKTSHCPSCNSRLVWHQNKNYCGECGRSVKWERALNL